MTNPEVPLHERFGGLDFEAFRSLATAEGLSDHNRLGFPDSYREGRERAILADVATKLTALAEDYAGPPGIVVDIGSGAGPVATEIQTRCRTLGHQLVLVDSPEMLARNPDASGLTKVSAQFPDCPEFLATHHHACVAVLAYSVLHCGVVNEFDFVDAAGELLAPGGRLLIGDLPNASRRKRFLASEAGARHHRSYTGRDEDPEVVFNVPMRGEIDDAMVLGLLARSRAAGLDAWVVPQSPDLPMANRREDILIARA